MTGTFIGTASTWVYPTIIDLAKFAEYANNNPSAANYGIPNELIPAYDLKVDGKVDMFDFAVMKIMVLRPDNNTLDDIISRYGYNPIYSDVTVKINPADSVKVIDITTTSSWGNNIECWFGVSGLQTTRINCLGAIAGYSITSSEYVHAGKDVYANYGTDNEVSLLDLAQKYATNLSYFKRHLSNYCARSTLIP